MLTDELERFRDSAFGRSDMFGLIQAKADLISVVQDLCMSHPNAVW